MFDISFKLSEFAIQAMLYEVSCFPSPGLVSPTSNGSHKDMNFYTFIDSTSALNKYMFEFALEGFREKDLKILFSKLREIGIKAETEMFNKTKGINTHKGMIFLMGITLAAISYTISNNNEFKCIKNAIKSMCKGLTDELLKVEKNSKNLSHGEKLYLEYGITGVRGEAENGIPLAFDLGLPHYEKFKDLDNQKRLLNTLLVIMSKCDDSTILHRHNFKTLNYVKNKAKEVLKFGGMYRADSIEVLNELNNEFIKKNISPGGSADILAIVVLLDLVKKEFFY
ncbi:triphosphoribosyl-dephospho-CoA synthase CitG [Clostridium thermobutyricum]